MQEPSSALASRIMRAHDNPSPPPGSTRRLSGSRRRSSILAAELDVTSMGQEHCVEAGAEAVDLDQEAIDVVEVRYSTPAALNHQSYTQCSEYLRYHPLALPLRLSSLCQPRNVART